MFGRLGLEPVREVASRCHSIVFMWCDGKHAMKVEF